MKSLAFFFCCLVLLIGPVAEAQTDRMSIADYLEKYQSIAVSEMQRAGIPASITLAQGILESDYGNSELATRGNNHFGIKCHSDWKGKKIFYDDDAANECFRHYKSAYESYIDHSKFLSNKGRYSSLFDLKITDYKGWARGLKKAGYATNPKYATLLINLIERHKLTSYDRMGSLIASNPGGGNSGVSGSGDPRVSVPSQGGSTSNSTSNPKPYFYYNRIKTVLYPTDVTINQVSQNYDIPVRRLRKYNDFKASDIPAHTKIYLQPKRNKAQFGTRNHRVRDGETIEIISQLYGVKLKKLYKRNKMSSGQKPAAGEIIFVRGKRKERPRLIGNSANSGTSVSSGSSSSSSNSGNSVPRPNRGKTHTVKSGDTLYKIAQKYGISVQDLKRANGLNSDSIRPGDKLVIPKN